MDKKYISICTEDNIENRKTIYKKKKIDKNIFHKF